MAHGQMVEDANLGAAIRAVAERKNIKLSTLARELRFVHDWWHPDEDPAPISAASGESAFFAVGDVAEAIERTADPEGQDEDDDWQYDYEKNVPEWATADVAAMLERFADAARFDHAFHVVLREAAKRLVQYQKWASLITDYFYRLDEYRDVGKPNREGSGFAEACERLDNAEDRLRDAMGLNPSSPD